MGISTFPAATTSLTVGKKFSGKITKPTTDPFLGNYSYGAASVNCTAFGNSTWVVISGAGRIYTSTDSLTWNPLKNNLLAAALTNTSDGNGTIPAHTGAQIGYRSTLRATALKYANGIWAVAISNGTILTSPDLITWTLRLTATQTGGGTAQFLAFGNGTWVSTNNTPKIYSSTDNGVTWTDRTTAWSTGAGASNSITRVIYANSLFIVIDSGGLITTSPDAVTFTARTGGFGGTSITDIATNGTGASDTTVIVGASGKWAYSTNGTTWTQNTANATVAHTHVIWDGSRFVILSTSTTLVWYSTNGIGSLTSAVARSSTGTPTTNSQIISTDGTGKVFVSASSTFTTSSNVTSSWNTVSNISFNGALSQTNRDGLNPMYHSAKDGNGKLWKVGTQDKVWTSTDNGATWTFANVATLTQFTNSTTSAHNDIYGFKYTNGVLFAFANVTTAGAALLYSTDNGATWAKATSVTGRIQGIAFGNGVYVAVTTGTVGASGTTAWYATTPSGTWTSIASGSVGGATSGLFYGNGDGTANANTIYDIQFDTVNGFFEIWLAPVNGTVGYSRSFDGINWIVQGQTTKTSSPNSYGIIITSPTISSQFTQFSNLNTGSSIDGNRYPTLFMFRTDSNGKQVVLTRNHTGTTAQQGIALLSRTITGYYQGNLNFSTPFGQTTPTAPYVNSIPVSSNYVIYADPLYLNYQEGFGWIAIYGILDSGGQEFIILTSSNGEYWDTAATLNYTANIAPLKFVFTSNDSDKLIIQIYDATNGTIDNTIILNTVISEVPKV